MTQFTEKELHERLAKAVVYMEDGAAEDTARAVVEGGFSAKDAILTGLAGGMQRVGDLFARKIYFVPEVLVCAQTMYRGFDILKEHVPAAELEQGAKVVVGVVQGDHHDIGKNIVALMLRTSGFTVYDLGKNVPPERFIEEVYARKPEIVALSTLMSTTLDSMRRTVEELRGEFNSGCPRIMVGGAPVTQGFADLIAVDYYGPDAQSAVNGANALAER